MGASIEYGWCLECGAVISLASSEGDSFDNTELHLAWHERQDRSPERLT